jgi:hypothetical protein
VQSVEQTLRAEQNNDLNSGVGGVRLQPLKPLTVNLEGEIGRASRPIYPISERNYHALGARVLYKTKTLALGGSAQSNYNFNSISLANYSSQARTWTADASWTPHDWLAFDANYSKLHLNTLGALAYFANGVLVTGDHSVYVSDTHALHVTARVGLGKRADLSFGYSRVEEDLSLGGALVAAPGAPVPVFGGSGGGFANFLPGPNTMPLTFESPLARFSLKLHENVRWNAGYQFYHYRDHFFPEQRYNAHTGYTSILWSF